MPMRPSLTCNQFWPATDMRSEYRSNICNKPGASSPRPDGDHMRQRGENFTNIDRGNIHDSFKLVQSLRQSGGGGVSRFKVDDLLQNEGRLESHRDHKAARQALVEEIEVGGFQSEYSANFGSGVPFESYGDSVRPAYGSTFHKTFELIKALRDNGGGGVSMFHVAPEMKVAEREWRNKEKVQHGLLNDNEMPRANITGLYDSTQPRWLGRLTDQSAETALKLSTRKLQGRLNSAKTRHKGKGKSRSMDEVAKRNAEAGGTPDSVTTGGGGGRAPRPPRPSTANHIRGPQAAAIREHNARWAQSGSSQRNDGTPANKNHARPGTAMSRSDWVSEKVASQSSSQRNSSAPSKKNHARPGSALSRSDWVSEKVASHRSRPASAMSRSVTKRLG